MIIDQRPFGGTCALRGCDLKKGLIAATEVIDGFERIGSIDTVKSELSIDWAALQRHKRSFTDPVPDKREQAYAKQGIDAFHGRARFTAPNSVEVDGTTLKGRHIVIAAGAEPVRLPIEGFEHLNLSDDFLELQTLPRRIALVGGGYIGIEFAHIAARAGAEVTILNRGKQPLTGFDPDLVTMLALQVTTVAGLTGVLMQVLLIFVGYMVFAAFLGNFLGRLFRLPPRTARSLIFSFGTRNSFVVLPFALTLPEAWHAAVVVIVYQSLVELFGMVAYLTWVPGKLIPEPSLT